MRDTLKYSSRLETGEQHVPCPKGCTSSIKAPLSQPSRVLDTEAGHLLFVKIFIKKKILATQLKDTKIMYGGKQSLCSPSSCHRLQGERATVAPQMVPSRDLLHDSHQTPVSVGMVLGIHLVLPRMLSCLAFRHTQAF